MPAIKLKKVTAEYLAEKENAKELEKNQKNLEDVAAEKEEEEDDSSKEAKEEKKSHNFLDVEVLFDKRKRTLPPVEQALVDWLDSNLEKKEDVNLPLPSLYNFYADVCQMQGSSIADIPVFNKYIKDKFGKCFGFKDVSPYKGLMKERKQKPKKEKVQGGTAQLKMRDVIAEVIGDAGNPRKGIRFHLISKAIVQKYPAKQVNTHPKILRSALERGVYYGHVELVRGVGMCGFYRLPGDPTKEEEDEKDKKKKSKDAGSEDDAVENGEEKPAEEDGEEKSADEKGKDEEAKGEEGEGEKKKVKKRKPKKKSVDDGYRSTASKHSNPQRVDDIFPMAITFQSDPKQASVAKIKSYIFRYYRKDLATDKLKRSLDAGVEKGLWEQNRGSYHLLSNTFQPGYSENLPDQIAQALVACNEPKEASAMMIKKYILDYHTSFKMEHKPHLFKNALERGCIKGSIRQMTGIGATGSYRLMDHFYPSPAILAGDSSDEEQSADEEDDDDDDPTEYVPRPTKRGRKAPKPDRHVPAAATSPRKSAGKAKRGGAEKSKSKAKAAPSRAKKSKVVYADSDSDEEEEEVVVEYTPRKSSSRGGTAPSKQNKKEVKKPAAKATAKKSSAKAKKSQPKSKKIVVESESEEEEAPPPKKGKAKPTPPKKGSAAKSSKGSKSPKSKKPSKKAVEVSSDDEDKEPVTPRRQSRDSSSKKRKYAESDSDEEEPVTPKRRPGRDSSSNKRKYAESDSDEDLEDEDMYVAKPSKRRAEASPEPKPSSGKKRKGRR